jgi:hypothetical protein
VSYSSGPDDPLLADEQIEAGDEINEVITAILTEQPFSSIRDISRLTHISTSKIQRFNDSTIQRFND